VPSACRRFFLSYSRKILFSKNLSDSSCQASRQNLEPQGLRGKIFITLKLEGAEVSEGGISGPLTSSDFGPVEGKVRCHMGLWKKDCWGLDQTSWHDHSWLPHASRCSKPCSQCCRTLLNLLSKARFIAVRVSCYHQHEMPSLRKSRRLGQPVSGWRGKDQGWASPRSRV